MKAYGIDYEYDFEYNMMVYANIPKNEEHIDAIVESILRVLEDEIKSDKSGSNKSE